MTRHKVCEHDLPGHVTPPFFADRGAEAFRLRRRSVVEGEGSSDVVATRTDVLAPRAAGGWFRTVGFPLVQDLDGYPLSLPLA